MSDDLEALNQSIRRVFPGSRIEPVTEQQLADQRRDYPDAPADYVEFLRRVGWGSLGRGNFMVYSGLVEPTDIFDAATAANLPGVLLVGDDFSGLVVGFDTRADWQLVGIDNGSQPQPLERQSLAEFIAQRVTDVQDDPSDS